MVWLDSPWARSKDKEGVNSAACSLLKVASVERALTSGNEKAKN